MDNATQFTKKSNSVVVLIFIMIPFLSFLQPTLDWIQNYGGSMLEMTYSVVPTSDGGYVMIGESKSNDGDITGHHNTVTSASFDQDVWVTKTDVSGNLLWEHSYGGTNTDVGFSIIETSDGGYIFTGSTFSNDGDVSGYHGVSAGVGGDAWVVKIDNGGAIIWQKCYGGTGIEIGRKIIASSEGGYMLGATAASVDGDVSGNNGSMDVWTVKITDTGVIEWQDCFGGSSNEGTSGLALSGNNYQRYDLFQASDGGYVVCTNSMSIDGDVTGHHGPGGIITINGVSHLDTDVWALKISNTGILQWQKSLGGTDEDNGYAIAEETGVGYVLVASTKSTDGDVTGSLGSGVHGWIVKLDLTGSIVWENQLGLYGVGCYLYSMTKTQDNGYFMTGKNGGDIICLKTDIAGNTQWYKTIGGSTLDAGTAGFQTVDGGYIVTGWSTATNGNIIVTNGGTDVILFKLSSVPANVISGNIYEDLNNNCIKDVGEVGLEGRIVIANPGNYIGTTNVNGDYSLFVNTGNYTINHLTQQFYNQSCPVANGVYSVSITNLTPNSFGNDFSDTLTSHCADLKINISTARHRRCFKNTYAITYSNIGALSASNSSIAVTFPTEIIPLTSSIPWSIVGGQYIFDLGTLNSFQGGILTIIDSVSCASALGTVICSSAIISTDTIECSLTNNSKNFCMNITGSCDPNSMEVESQITDSGYLVEELITGSDTLSYMIKFQNIGNDTTFTVVVRDTLSNYLNAESIELTNSSHPYTFRIYGQGICEWTFNDIFLTDTISNELESHGFITFTILQNAGNLPGTVINNRAGIWFDYNSSINTNGTINTILDASAGIVEMETTNSMNVFPNPFTASATIVFNSKVENAELVIIDIQGSEVRRVTDIDGEKLDIDKGDLSKGIYLFRLKEMNGAVSSGKIVVE